jgi:hypothetical protein
MAVRINIGGLVCMANETRRSDNMPEPLAEARKRAQRFWFRDGLDEIVIGIIILLQNGFTLAIRLGNSSSARGELIVVLARHPDLSTAACCVRTVCRAHQGCDP